MRLSVVLPTYNERKNLPLVIEKIEAALKRYQGQYEILIVDDNSPDKTYALGREISRKKDWVRVIRRTHDKGLSSAIVAGFAAGKGDALIVMDADMQHDENILPKMLETLEEGFHIVVGSRKTEDGGVENWAFYRKIISWIASCMARIALPVGVKDPMSGYFGLTKDVFEKLAPGINPRGFKILMEFIAKSQGLRIKEIGYIFRDRQFGESKLSPSVMINYLISLYELTLGKLVSIQFLKYSIVGFVGVLVNQWGLWLGIQPLDLSKEYALILGIEMSIITNFIFNNYWTFREKSLRKTSDFLTGLAKFNFICFTGAGVNYGVALFLSTKLGIDIYLSNLIGIGVSTVWNYMINVRVTWEN